jgi:ABC-2 type transport system ATP-binding protein
LYGIPSNQVRNRVDELLEMVDLDKEADVSFQYYSTGMKQKLAIVRGLLHRPRILFMDEPTRSLDPISTRNVRRFIQNSLINLIGGSIIIATHDLEEAENLCHQVAVMHRGRVLSQGHVDQLRLMFHQYYDYHLEINDAPPALIEKIRCSRGVMEVGTENDREGSVGINVRLLSGNSNINKILELIMSEGKKINTCFEKKASLETIFHSIIQEAERDV